MANKVVVLGCRVESLPFRYLGLPLRGDHRGIAFWRPLVEKFSLKLEKWKKLLLSKGGRLTLAQLVLNSLPIFYFSLLKAIKGASEYY